MPNFSQEELNLLRSVEASEWQSLQNVDSEIDRYQKIAEEQTKHSRNQLINQEVHVLVLQPDTQQTYDFVELVKKACQKIYEKVHIEHIEKLQYIYINNQKLIEYSIDHSDFIVANLKGGNVSVTESLSVALEKDKKIILTVPENTAFSIRSEFSHLPFTTFRFEDQQKSVTKLSQYIRENISASEASEKIVKGINFQEGYADIFASILSYFSHVLHVKYPNEEVKISIEQERSFVRMIIVTSQGRRDIIEQSLEQYISVISGKLSPESLLYKSLEVQRLKYKIRSFQQELDFIQKSLKSQEAAESLVSSHDNFYTLLESSFG